MCGHNEFLIFIIVIGTIMTVGVHFGSLIGVFPRKNISIQL